MAAKGVAIILWLKFCQLVFPSSNGLNCLLMDHETWS